MYVPVLRSWKWIITICIFAVLLIYSTTLLNAQEKPVKSSFRVDPAFIEIDTTHDAKDRQMPIRYTNFTTSNISVELDFLPVTFAKNDVGMEFPQTKSVLASHIIPSANTFSIGPGETKTILLYLTDLDQLAATDFYEALTARVITQDSARRTSGATVIANITTLILLRNGGKDAFPSYRLDTKNALFPKVLFLYPKTVTTALTNTGKTYGVPRGVITITDMLGNTISQGAFNTDSIRIFPGSTRLLDAELKTGGSPLSTYIATYRVELYDDNLKGVTKISQKGNFIVLDPLFGVLALLALPAYVIFLGYVSRVKKNRKTLDSTARPTGKYE